MSWTFRTISMMMIVFTYFFVIRPGVPFGMFRSIIDMMVGLGIFLFGLGFFMDVVPKRRA